MHKHMGTGVWFIRNASQLPAEEDLAGGTYVVQPFREQRMGQGAYFRRHEIRLYLALTSVTPLRLYAYREPWVNLAHRRYDPSAPTPDKCMLDTHAHMRGCRSEGLDDARRAPSFDEFCARHDLDAARRRRFERSARDAIAQVVEAAQPTVAAHPVNAGVVESGAACFSFMRADLFVGADGEAGIYEINEFPFANEKGSHANRVQGRAYHDLFEMMGLDRPALPAEERGEYEASHLGGWIPLFD